MLDKKIRRTFTKLHQQIRDLPAGDGHERAHFRGVRNLLVDAETRLSLHYSGDQEAKDNFYRHEHL